MARKGWKQRKEAEEAARKELGSLQILPTVHVPEDHIPDERGLTKAQWRVVRFFQLLASVDLPEQKDSLDSEQVTTASKSGVDD